MVYMIFPRNKIWMHARYEEDYYKYDDYLGCIDCSSDFDESELGFHKDNMAIDNFYEI